MVLLYRIKTEKESLCKEKLLVVFVNTIRVLTGAILVCYNGFIVDFEVYYADKK